MSPNHMKMLYRLTNYLQIKKIQYWLDSGALLGLYREGSLLSWDDDIDIGVWETGRDVLIQQRTHIRNLGYTFSIQKYKGVVYSITLKPIKRSSHKPIHIHVFFKAGRCAWSPQVVACQPKPEPQPDWANSKPSRMRSCILWFKKEALRSLGMKGVSIQRMSRLIFCLPIWGIFYLIKEPLDRKLWVTLWPYRLIYQVHTWVVPIEFFSKLSTMVFQSCPVYVPENTELYLKLRYGNWEKENRQWYYWRDDNSLYYGEPDQVLKMENCCE